MRNAIGSDDTGPLTEALLDELTRRGIDVERHGALLDDSRDWVSAGRAVGEAVASGRAAMGIVCCWTGTGISIAANKVAGIRAALCGDAPTAAGARKWNDANVLALSLRLTSRPALEEILDAWFAAAPSTDPDDVENVAHVDELDRSATARSR